MKRRYGADNVIAGYVHMDETTPQIHVCVVPEAISRKTGRRTVSSASLLTRAELRNFHQDLKKEMLKVFGKDAEDYIYCYGNDCLYITYKYNQGDNFEKDYQF